MKKLDVVSIRLIKGRPLLSDKPIHSPEDAVKLLGEELCMMDREVMCVINMRADGMPINCDFASIGSVNECYIYPRELFKSSILSNAVNMLIMHNHPSGHLEPSNQDTAMTDRMLKLCDMMGIPLLDHIIVGGDNSSYFSFKERGILNYTPEKMETRYDLIDSARFAVAESGSEVESTQRRRRAR